MPGPAVSIVLCTYNRCETLRRALDAVLHQTGDVRYEVVILDNNSTDLTRELVNSRVQAHPHLRYHFEPRQGKTYALNTGIQVARAPILVFTDDDVTVPPDWVRTILDTFAAHPDVDMIAGRVLPIWPAVVPSWLTRRQLGPFALGDRGDVPVRVHAGNAAPCLVGANCAFRREVFERIGLFDPRFDMSEDREFQLRLWRAGGQGLYVPEMAIEVEIPVDRMTKKYFRYWYSTYGRLHSRMRLLDTLDHHGRLMPPPDRTLLGVPPFVYREFLGNLSRWLFGHVRLDGSGAFYWENRTRYLFSYIRERYREHLRSPAARFSFVENWRPE